MLELLGVKATLKAIDTITTGVAMVGKKKIVDGVAQKVEQLEKQHCPKDDHVLEGSIGIEEQKNNLAEYLVFVGVRDGMLPKTKQGKHYGIFQEYGLSQMGAHPFVRPAGDACIGMLERAAKSLF